MELKYIRRHSNPLLWVKDFWFLASPYWKRVDRYKSIVLLILVVIFNLLVITVSVLINQWSNRFYDAIQQYNKDLFFKLLLQFTILAFFAIACSVLAFYFRKILEIRWRKWLTNHYLEQWFSNQSYYKIRFLPQLTDNPDQRISEDISSFIMVSFDLILGLLNAVVTIISFSIILWGLSGILTFALNGHHFTIHGYLVWAALFYAVLGTYITFKIGKPLIKLDYKQQSYEAHFRYSLVHVREYSENIAFYKGEAQEKQHLMQKFNNVFKNFVAIVYRQLKIDFFTVAYEQAIIIFPFLVASSRYFAKIIKLGDLIQISRAFVQIQNSLSFFIASYSALSEWRATMDRLLGFQNAIQHINELQGLPIENINTTINNKLNENAYILKLENINLNLPNNTLLAKNITFTLQSGDRLIIKGRSGCGKTTLLRTIAGLWHFAEGSIYQKPNIKSLFISQKPYLPIEHLKDAICYPLINDLPDDLALNKILHLCHLDNLIDKLNLTGDWNNILSLGEQQRVAFCRILINAPDIVYLDEATSALDEETEAELYQLLINELPNTIIISVAHRNSVIKWHNQELNFNTHSA